MSDPKPTPPPRSRKARRKLSPGQVAFLEKKAVRDKAKAERESKQRQDAWYLHHFHPEIAKAKRAKGVENNAKACAWRRQMFVESFADWPAVLTAGEMGYRIREWLRDPSRATFNSKAGRWRWKFRGCEKHFVKKETSVRKKLTELKVFRFNFRLGAWFKCGSVEEAEATKRLAEQESERCRLEREEAARVEQNRLKAEWAELEANQKKRQAAEQAERDRLSRPAVVGWHDFIPEELKPTARAYFVRGRSLTKEQSLDDLSALEAERFSKHDRAFTLSWLQGQYDREMHQVAEAVLVAD